MYRMSSWTGYTLTLSGGRDDEAGRLRRSRNKPESGLGKGTCPYLIGKTPLFI